ncbi:MAG: sensory protein TspO [Halothiobacillus sp. 13-55-253]|jgi:tryptophan-rich sensory protein|nr:MAG: sensory protein TspO [Halothiobacillus sp. 13-55-253]
MSSFLVYAISFVLVILVAASGGRFRPDRWYAELKKPVGLPPNWVFPVVWISLYAMMAVAAAWVWLAEPSDLRTAGLIIYAAQLVFNTAWSWLFFGLHRTGLALIDLLVLITLVSINTWLFVQVDTWAGLLLVPYLIWLLIALYLNASVCWLNRRT